MSFGSMEYSNMSEGILVVIERLLENSSIKSKEKVKDIKKWRKRRR
jgi:hypothetical protein